LRLARGGVEEAAGTIFDLVLAGYTFYIEIETYLAGLTNIGISGAALTVGVGAGKSSIYQHCYHNTDYCIPQHYYDIYYGNNLYSNIHR
jgi:hypothetical protein